MVSHKISRRKLLRLSIPAAGFIYTGGLSGLISCKDRSAGKESKNDTTANNQHPRKPKKTPSKRGNPYAGRDEMFLHNKTKALHYPFVFDTYDKLKEDHFTNVNTSDWEKQLDNGAHFTKDGSALIFERLAFRNLQNGINDESISRSALILGRSFKGDYAKQNMYNWRGYHLLAQMTALNTALSTGDKWTSFSNATRDTNVSQAKKIPKRHAWITSQQLFDQRVQYIQQHSAEYMNRLKKRLV